MTFATRLRAMIKHEVPATDVEALLRGAGQLEDLRQQIEAKRQAGEVAHPGRPWETHAEMGLALAFFWVAQGFVIIARALNEADDEMDPGTKGYLPEVSHHQAMALLRQVAEHLGLAYAALADPLYDGGRSLPIPLQPRIEAEDRCPVSHLKGMLRGAQRLDGYAQVEITTYCNAVATTDAPEAVKVAARRLQAELARAQSGLGIAEQAVFPILNGEPVDHETREEAENYLWSALEAYIWLGQAVAMPFVALPSLPNERHSGTLPPHQRRRSRKIGPNEKWCLTSETARQKFLETGLAAWARGRLDEFWRDKGWTLSAKEQRYLDEVAELERQGAITTSSYLAECPFNPVWTALSPLKIMNHPIRPGKRFAYDHHPGAQSQLMTQFEAVEGVREPEYEHHHV